MEKIYEGKGKVVYSYDEEHYLLVFKDTATAFDGAKKEEVRGKGELNCKITSIIFELLEERGIRTHFVKRLDERSILVKRAKPFPLEVVVRNYSAGSLCKRYGLKEGQRIEPPLVETFLKSDELHDPLICLEHVKLLNLAKEEEFLKMKELALKVNEVLRETFEEVGIILADFKLEFGKDLGGNILVIDEISPDSCRLWDKETKEKLDKDRFRFDLGDLLEGYRKVLKRLER